MLSNGFLVNHRRRPRQKTQLEAVINATWKRGVTLAIVEREEQKVVVVCKAIGWMKKTMLHYKEAEDLSDPRDLAAFIRTRGPDLQTRSYLFS